MVADGKVLGQKIGDGNLRGCEISHDGNGVARVHGWGAFGFGIIRDEPVHWEYAVDAGSHLQRNVAALVRRVSRHDIVRIGQEHRRERRTIVETGDAGFPCWKSGEW